MTVDLKYQVVGALVLTAKSTIAKKNTKIYCEDKLAKIVNDTECMISVTKHNT